ncbi:MAG: DUF1206 domain-containing protein [Sumerlaeia bacterium]
MANAKGMTHEAADQAVPNRDSRSPLEILARTGFVAKGVVYLIVGVLAAQAAFSGGGEGQVTGSKGAISSIADEPFGQIMLVLMGIGLVAYVAWRAAQAVLDPERENNGKSGWVKRAYHGASAVLYTGLAIQAFALVIGNSSGGGQGGGAKGWTAKLMSQPFGQWLVGIFGAIIVIVGLIHFYKNVVKAEFWKKLKRHEMTNKVAKAVKVFGRAGYASRAVIFGIIGGFFIVAAIQQDPNEARGLGGALNTLATTSYGPWLLGVVAIGVAAYGAYQFVKARFRDLSGAGFRKA